MTPPLVRLRWHAALVVAALGLGLLTLRSPSAHADTTVICDGTSACSATAAPPAKATAVGTNGSASSATASGTSTATSHAASGSAASGNASGNSTATAIAS